MYDYNLIKKVLGSYINEGTKNFIIYPFGENGVRVKNILQEYFNILPRLIVDNIYCEYNPNLIGFDKLGEKIQEDDYIILTMENREINKAMKIEIEKICDKYKIINLYDIKNEYNKVILRNYFQKKDNEF